MQHYIFTPWKLLKCLWSLCFLSVSSSFRKTFLKKYPENFCGKPATILPSLTPNILWDSPRLLPVPVSAWTCIHFPSTDPRIDEKASSKQECQRYVHWHKLKELLERQEFILSSLLYWEQCGFVERPLFVFIPKNIENDETHLSVSSKPRSMSNLG